MKVTQLVDVLDAKIISGGRFLDNEVLSACGSDLMSDVLAFVKDQSVLVTGLTNAQAIRTAMMMDIVCIVLVRGKTANESMIDLADENEIVILQTEHSMFTTCGLLYQSGLRGESGLHRKLEQNAG